MASASSLNKIFAFLIFLILAFFFGCAQQVNSNPSQPALGAFGSAHAHADFKLYINNVQFNFSQEKYMTPVSPGSLSEECGANSTSLAHLHNMDGDLAHSHATGVTWGYLFSTLNFTISGNCLTLGNSTQYCSNENEKWRFFVNDSEVPSLANYEIHDMDRVLLTYGANDAQINEQLASVTHKAADESKSAVPICAAPANASANKN